MEATCHRSSPAPAEVTSKWNRGMNTDTFSDAFPYKQYIQYNKTTKQQQKERRQRWRQEQREKQQVVSVIWQQAASPPHMDGSMIFARWRQCTLHLIHASFGPPESKSRTASRSVQPLLHRSWQSVPILHNGPPYLFPSELPHPMEGSGPPSNTWFLGPTRVLNPNGILTSSAVFWGLTDVTDWQADHATGTVTIGRLYTHSTAMWPNNNNTSAHLMWCVCWHNKYATGLAIQAGVFSLFHSYTATTDKPFTHVPLFTNQITSNQICNAAISPI